MTHRMNIYLRNNLGGWGLLLIPLIFLLTLWVLWMAEILSPLWMAMFGVTWENGVWIGFLIFTCLFLVNPFFSFMQSQFGAAWLIKRFWGWVCNNEAGNSGLSLSGSVESERIQNWLRQLEQHSKLKKIIVVWSLLALLYTVLMFSSGAIGLEGGFNLKSVWAYLCSDSLFINRAALNLTQAAICLGMWMGVRWGFIKLGLWDNLLSSGVGLRYLNGLLVFISFIFGALGTVNSVALLLSTSGGVGFSPVACLGVYLDYAWGAYFFLSTCICVFLLIYLSNHGALLNFYQEEVGPSGVCKYVNFCIRSMFFWGTSLTLFTYEVSLCTQGSFFAGFSVGKWLCFLCGFFSDLLLFWLLSFCIIVGLSCFVLWIVLYMESSDWLYKKYSESLIYAKTHDKWAFRFFICIHTLLLVIFLCLSVAFSVYPGV